MIKIELKKFLILIVVLLALGMTSIFMVNHTPKDNKYTKAKLVLEILDKNEKIEG